MILQPAPADRIARISIRTPRAGSDTFQPPMRRFCPISIHAPRAGSDVPYHVALGLIYVESRFDPEAVSPAGCYGLTQLNPRYFPSGLSPAKNIEAGMDYLGSLIKRCGDLSAALCSYHDGHDTGRRGYSNAVLEAAGRWK